MADYIDNEVAAVTRRGQYQRPPANLDVKGSVEAALAAQICRASSPSVFASISQLARPSGLVTELHSPL